MNGKSIQVSLIRECYSNLPKRSVTRLMCLGMLWIYVMTETPCIVEFNSDEKVFAILLQE